jgi:hypothetical protein
MNTFFNTCRKCLNPWVAGLIILLIAMLIYFAPIIGVGTLTTALPLLGCTIMCGAMGFMRKDKKKSE